jgi:hypothetical protein
MRKLLLSVFGLSIAFLIPHLSFGQVDAQQSLNPDEYMKGEEFTKILKDEWSYLKDEVDEYIAATKSKSEFETSKEYADRIARTKASLIAKINSHIQEKKYDKRVFGVLFKASLGSYDADRQQYIISGSGTVEAPYDIPTLECIVPKNQFVVLTDSVNRGFRTSALRIRIPHNYRWSVPRDEAKAANANEANIYYQVRFVLDLHQEDLTKQATIRIIPTQISMLNVESHKVYWIVDIK